MDEKYKVSRNQLLALCTVSFLAPALRLFPASSAQLAGRGAWLSAAAALPFMLCYVLLLSKLMDRARRDEGLAELILRLFGKTPGRILLLIFALWYLLYGGFVLRTGADRLITTVYPRVAPGYFVISMGLLCLLASLCPLRSIVRTAKMVLPAVLGMLLLMLFFALFSVDRDNLLPLGLYDALPVLKSGLSAVNVTVGVLYSICFLGGTVKSGGGRLGSYARWMCFASLLLSLINLCITGCFGAPLTSRLTRPFFSLVRSLVFFSSIERLEALLVTLWVFPDFLLVTLVLSCAQHCLRLVLSSPLPESPPAVLSFRHGRWLIWLCAVVAMVLGLVLAPDTASMELWSRHVIPYINLGFAFLVMPGIYLAVLIKKVPPMQEGQRNI